MKSAQYLNVELSKQVKLHLLSHCVIMCFKYVIEVDDQHADLSEDHRRQRRMLNIASQYAEVCVILPVSHIYI